MTLIFRKMNDPWSGREDGRDEGEKHRNIRAPNCFFPPLKKVKLTFRCSMSVLCAFALFLPVCVCVCLKGMVMRDTH